MDPIQKFINWYKKELKFTQVKIPNACCLSTNGLDDFPNARIVALKEIKNDTFVITGSLSSRKGIEIKNDPKVALTFWWTSTETQVRIQGIAEEISPVEADIYFQQRSLDSQLVSSHSKQGETIDMLPKLKEEINESKAKLKAKFIDRPTSWGGFSIRPIRIEFLEFAPDRFHTRTLYIRQNGEWEVKLLQP